VEALIKLQEKKLSVRNIQPHWTFLTEDLKTAQFVDIRRVT
jgi:hypothetical protein